MTLDAVAIEHPLSASQIETFNDCPAKWGYDKVERIPRPPNKYAQRGTAVHAVGEDWLDRGIEIDLSTDAGKIFGAGVKFLPLPKTGLIEYEFWLTTETALYRGKWDRWKPFENYRTTVHDHKSTSDFKWLKPFDVLRTDVQANIYAVAALKAASYVNIKKLDPTANLPDAPIDPEHLLADLNWIYYLANPKKPAARRVNLIVLPNDAVDEPARPDKVRPEHFGVIRQSELEENWTEIENTANKMLDVFRQGARASDLEKKLSACEKFGGCPYRNKPCKLTISQIMRGHMENSAALDKIKAKMAAAKLASAASATTASTTETKPTETKSIAAKIASTPAATVPKITVPKLVSIPKPGTAAAVQSQPPAVNPPETTITEGDVDEAETASNVLEEAYGAVATRSPAVGDLRDVIATHQAAALVSSRLFDYNSPSFSERVAHAAYELADQMLLVRAK